MKFISHFLKYIRLYIETARSFSREEKSLLADALARKFKEKISMEIRLNPELISGIFIKYKDKIYDYSVRTQLNKLERGLVR